MKENVLYPVLDLSLPTRLRLFAFRYSRPFLQEQIVYFNVRLEVPKVVRFVELRNEIEEQVPSLTEPSTSSVSSRRNREEKFKNLVKRLYDDRCAVCCSSLRDPDGNPEVQSAHIYPKSKNGSDDLRNGLCLCRMHHWAFDVGWFSISDSYGVLIRSDLPQTSDYEFIRSRKGMKIRLPKDQMFHPHQLFLQAHRNLMGFE
ncbi:HNH endonuclease [Tumebacillus amylolyticus]